MPLPAAVPRLCPLPPRASARRRLVSLAAAVPCLCLPPPCVFAAFAPRLCLPPLRVSACCRPVPLAAVVGTLHASPQCAKINTAVFSVRSAAQPSVSGVAAKMDGSQTDRQTGPRQEIRARKFCLPDMPARDDSDLPREKAFPFPIFHTAKKVFYELDLSRQLRYHTAVCRGGG